MDKYRRLTQRRLPDSSASGTRYSPSRGLSYIRLIQWVTTTLKIHSGHLLQSRGPFNSRGSTRLKAQGLRATCPSVFSPDFMGKAWHNFRLIHSLNLRFDLRLRGYIPYGMRFFKSHFPYGFFFRIVRVQLKTFKRRTRGRLGTTREDSKTTQGSGGVPSSLGMLQVFLRTFVL
jgi:hypothetical protein